MSVNPANPVYAKPSGLQGYLSKGGLTVDTIDKMLMAQSLDLLMVQNPQIGKLIEAYLRMAQVNLHNLTSRDREAEYKATYGMVEMYPMSTFKAMEVQGEPGKDFLFKDFLEQPDKYRGFYGLKDGQLNAMKTIFSLDSHGASLPSTVTSGQTDGSQGKQTWNSAEVVPSQQGGGQGSMGGGQQGQEEDESQEGQGFGFNKAMKEGSTFNKAFGPAGPGPTPPPGFQPPPSSSANNSSSSEFGMGQYGSAEEYVEGLEGTGLEQMFAILFENESKGKDLYTQILTRLETRRQAKAKIIEEMGSLDPTTPEGQKKLRQLQAMLEDFQTTERQDFEQLNQLQRVMSEFIEMVSKFAETNFRTREQVIRNWRPGWS